VQLNTITRPVITSGQMQVAQATIKSSRKVFDMFSDQTYANKPVAICRELVANGIDAHVAAGTPDVPVHVTMPTELEPEFKVKDQGTGMAHDFVMGPFMAYTDGSTKDQSNDQIGGFGIGSKSPFAYTDQFTLRVVHEGVLSVYTMFKDEDGIPSVGLVAQTTTDEHSGVEVSFPVELQDMDDFRSAAQTALQYFHPLPTVENGTLTPPDYSHVSKTGKWAMRPSSGSLGVIMGGVRYPVNTDSLPWSLRRDSKVSPLLEYGIDLTLPIGSCDIAMSREALSYTERTSQSITKALSSIVDEVAATFATLFDKHPTLWAAKVALYKEVQNLSGGRGYGSSSNGRTGMLRQYAKYKGKPLTMDVETVGKSNFNIKTRLYDWTFPAGFPKGASAWGVALRTYGVQRMPTPKFQALGSEMQSITPGAWPRVLVDDMEVAGKSRTRARVEEFLDKHSLAQVLVLRAATTTSKKDIKELLDFIGNPEVVYLSSLPEPSRKIMVRTATGTSTVVRPKVRMFKFNGQKDTYGNAITNLSPAHSKRGAVTEIPYAEQPTTGILVVLNAWAFPEGFLKKMATGVVKWDELLFVNTSDGPKLKDAAFKAFDIEFEVRFNAEKNKYPDLPKWLAIADNEDLEDVFSTIRKFRPFLKLTSAQKTTAFGKIVTLYDENVVPLTSDLRGFATHADITAKAPDGFDGKALNAAYEKEHPFFVQLVKLLGYRLGADSNNTKLLLNNL
jgi:hypothetical protein